MKKVIAAVLFVVTLVAAYASLSVVPTVQWQIVGPKGKELDRVLLAWKYRGGRFNLVHSVSYEKPGGVTELKSGLTPKLGGFIELHRPLDTGLEPWIEIVYVPELHNAFGPIGRLSESKTASRELDLEQHAVTVSDLADDPELWARSLDAVYSYIAHELSDKETMTPERKEALVVWAGVLLTDYRQFIDRYAEVKRAIPENPAFWLGLPDEEIARRRQEMIERFAREPLWGQYLQRMWKNNLVYLRTLTGD